MSEGGRAPSRDDVLQVLTPEARELLEAVEALQRQSDSPELGLNHWLLALVERLAPLVETLVAGLDVAALAKQLREQISQGNVGPVAEPVAVVRLALQLAAVRGERQASERDLAVAVLSAAGYKPALPTPILDHFGRDLTALAAKGQLLPAIGREEEIALTIETLCRQIRRNPLLLGPPGVGQTAVVEGVAQRIARGEVPPELRGLRLVEIQPSALIAGVHDYAEFDRRVEGMLAEVVRGDVLLFLGEIDAIVGIGGAPGVGGMATRLKPALLRGDVTFITATTDDQYRRLVEPDEALARRFQPIRVKELSAEQAFLVLAAARDRLKERYGIFAPDEVLRLLVDLSQQYIRYRYLPEKALDLLERCAGFARSQGKEMIGPEDARSIVERVIGMPLELTNKLDCLRSRLHEQAILSTADVNALLRRLEVTTRGLDFRHERPNAVVLLAGRDRDAGDVLSETIAGCLFGDPARVVSLDLTTYTSEQSVWWLLGPPPGTPGHGGRLPIHQIGQTPWCVFRLEQIQAAHPAVRDVLAKALADGFITDSSGRRIHLSETVVVMTVRLPEEAHRRLGFPNSSEAPLRGLRMALEEMVGRELLEQVHLICTQLPSSDADLRRWLHHSLLEELAGRYRRHGIELSWDESLLDWLISSVGPGSGPHDYERLLDDLLSPLVIEHLPDAPGQTPVTVLARVEQGKPLVEAGAARQPRDPGT